MRRRLATRLSQILKEGDAWGEEILAALHPDKPTKKRGRGVGAAVSHRPHLRGTRSLTNDRVNADRLYEVRVVYPVLLGELELVPDVILITP